MTDETTAILEADRTANLSTTRYVRELAARGVPVLRIARLIQLPAPAVEAIHRGQAVAAPDDAGTDGGARSVRQAVMAKGASGEIL